MSMGICTLALVGLLVRVTLTRGRGQAGSSAHGLREVLVGMGSNPPLMMVLGCPKELEDPHLEGANQYPGG